MELNKANCESSNKLFTASLQSAIQRAVSTCLEQQNSDGRWQYNLEGYIFTPAACILCMKYIGQSGYAIKVDLFRKLGNYIRRKQLTSGGWSVEAESYEVDVSTSVLAYFALKIIGDLESDDHMVAAREAILAHGGLFSCNYLVRLHLALHGIIPWSDVIEMPVEIMLLPRWFPFNIYKISASRILAVPMFVLRTMKKTAPSSVNLDELLVAQKTGSKSTFKHSGKYDHQSWPWYIFFKACDRLAKTFRPILPNKITKRATSKAVKYVTKRLNGLDGYGCICESIMLVLMMFHALGYTPDHPDFEGQMKALQRFIVHDTENSAYIAHFFGSVWDTSFTILSLLETEEPSAITAAKKGIDWLIPLQILDFKGDWAVKRPNLRPGAWAYHSTNEYYPDLDDTSVVITAIHRHSNIQKSSEFSGTINRGVEWILGMQCKNGGWGAFDAENTAVWLDSIPLLDKKALTDPPTADITSRCLSAVTQVTKANANARSSKVKKLKVKRGIKFLLETQENDGSWYGCWGVNYIYGTWSAVAALNSAGFGYEDEVIRKAATWLLKIQNADGSWGEDSNSYRDDYCGHVKASGSADQTAWALLGLMAAECVEHPAVENGIQYLLNTQQANGQWDDSRYTGVVLANVVYYINHGYCKYFPLWAIARFYRLKRHQLTKVDFGL